MDICELKQKFEEVITTLEIIQKSRGDFVNQCVNLFEIGSFLYDNLPEVEKILITSPHSSPKDVVDDFKIIDCIIDIGRTEEVEMCSFKAINIAKFGEETNSKTIKFGWAFLNELNNQNPSGIAIQKILVDKLQELLEKYRLAYNKLIDRLKM